LTEFEAGGEIIGKGGAKFKAVSSFPKVVNSCQLVVDKIDGLKKIKYVDHHLDKNGNISIKEKTVKRRVF
jgi:hypothetical protein